MGLQMFCSKKEAMIRDFFFSQDVIYVIRNLLHLKEIVYYSFIIDQKREIEKDFYKKLLFELDNWIGKNYSCDQNSGDVMKFLAFEAAKHEKSIFELAKIEEIYAQNYANSKKPIVKEGRNMAWSSLYKTGSSMKLEFCEFDYSKLLKSIQIMVNVIFSLEFQEVKRTIEEFEKNNEKQQGNQHKSTTNHNSQISEKPQTDKQVRQSLVNRPMGSKVGMSTISMEIPEPNSVDSYKVSFITDKKIKKNQFLSTFGYNNFGQLGFSKDL